MKIIKENIEESKKLKENKSVDYDINLAEYIYDNLDVEISRHGYYTFDEDVLTYEDVIEDYDDRITRKVFNKTKSIVVKALQEEDLKFYTPYNSDTLIELSDNHTLWQINVPIDEVEYGAVLEQYLEKFTQETGVEIFTEGRSGRHICVPNTVDNLIRFSELQDVQSRLESEMINHINTNYNEYLEESRKLKEKYNIKDGAQEKVGLVMADAMRSLNRTNKIRKDYIDDAFERVTDKKMHGPVNHNPKRSAASKKMKLSEALFESHIDKMLTKDELKKLRSEIRLNSLYTKDYENSFGIDPKDVQMFFDGYLDDLEEIYIIDNKIEPEDADIRDVITTDTIKKLYDYYTSFDNLPF